MKSFIPGLILAIAIMFVWCLTRGAMVPTTEAAEKPKVNLVMEGCFDIMTKKNSQEAICRFQDLDKDVTCWIVLTVQGRGLTCLPNSQLKQTTKTNLIEKVDEESPY